MRKLIWSALIAASLIAAANARADDGTAWRSYVAGLRPLAAQAANRDNGGCKAYASLHDRHGCERWGSPPPLGEVARRMQEQVPLTVLVFPAR